MDFSAFVIHHTAGNMSLSQIKEEYKRRHEGYHRVVDAAGNVYSIETIGVRSNGAYSERWAGPYINLSLIGAYHLRPVPAAQLEAAIQATAILMKRYQIPITKLSTHLQIGQRWGYGTACPGSYFMGVYPYFRSRVYKYLGDYIPSSTPGAR